MNVWTRIGLPLTAVGAITAWAAIGAIGGGATAITACSSSSSSSSGGSGSGSGGNNGGPCVATPGTVPNPECDDGDETQCKASTSCKIDAKCGDSTTCEPFANNTAATKNFRLRRLHVVAPPNLNTTVVQNTVVTNGVDLSLAQCGENGTGEFNWLMSLDTSANTLKTGGAPSSADPIGTGYCFVNKTVGSLAVAPVTVPMKKGTDGTYTSDPLTVLNIPIYFQGAIIVLPISYGSISGMKVSADGNCIGKMNTKALAADCSDNPANCSKWLTDGALTGYITLETADGVDVALLHESLCVVLTGSTKDPATGKCQRDGSGKIKFPGDYCSTTKTAGGCKDAFWLAATFAASAVKINDGTGVADCSGGGTPPADAGADTSPGVDSSAPADAASE